MNGKNCFPHSLNTVITGKRYLRPGPCPVFPAPWKMAFDACCVHSRVRVPVNFAVHHPEWPSARPGVPGVPGGAVALNSSRSRCCSVVPRLWALCGEGPHRFGSWGRGVRKAPGRPHRVGLILRSGCLLDRCSLAPLGGIRAAGISSPVSEDLPHQAEVVKV